MRDYFRNRQVLGSIRQLDVVVPEFFPKTGLVAYYKLDGNSNDAHGSNNGTDTSITYSLANGKIDQGAGFNGSSSRIIANPFNRSGSQPITVSAWIKPSRTAGQYQVIIANRENLIGFRWQFYMHTTNGEISFHGASQNKGTYTPPTSSWTHCSATVDSSGNLKIYINGELQDSFTSFTYWDSGDSTNIGIGGIAGSGGEYYQGSIDEVGIWSRALTSDEISQLYNNGNGLTY